MRPDGRRPDQLRPLEIIPNYQKHAEGSALIKLGDTWVLCAASIEEGVPSFLKGKGQGWLTAEYAMLPRSTHTRSKRDPGGRGKEIQRLIGRSLRAAIDLSVLGERTIAVDCDVLCADGGTRVASITGAWVALALAIRKLVDGGKLPDARALRPPVAAVSVGVVGGEVVLDLPYVEDSAADVDMNVVGTEDGKLIEVQGTAEHASFDRAQLDAMLDLAAAGIQQLAAAQRKIAGLPAAMTPRPLVFATHNRGKLVELRALLPGIDVRSLDELDRAIAETIEDRPTLEGNAIKKAREVSAATGLPALADDSGLEVDALGGAPGVLSARYAGAGHDDAANNAKLLVALARVPAAQRTARFRSVLALADEPRALVPVTAEGRCEGTILDAPRGTGGFGYDPLFYSPELAMTFAEAGVGPKNDLSHRARAMAALRPRLLDYLRSTPPGTATP